jgi:hypothetical protein
MMAEDRSDKFTWGDGDVEHHGVVDEVVWKHVTSVPPLYKEAGSTDMHVAVNMRTKEAYAGVSTVEVHGTKFYVVSYTSKEKSFAEPYNTMDEAMAAANAVISNGVAIACQRRDSYFFALGLEDFQ